MAEGQVLSEAQRKDNLRRVKQDRTQYWSSVSQKTHIIVEQQKRLLDDLQEDEKDIADSRKIIDQCRKTLSNLTAPDSEDVHDLHPLYQRKKDLRAQLARPFQNINLGGLNFHQRSLKRQLEKAIETGNPARAERFLKLMRPEARSIGHFLAGLVTSSAKKERYIDTYSELENRVNNLQTARDELHNVRENANKAEIAVAKSLHAIAHNPQLFEELQNSSTDQFKDMMTLIREAKRHNWNTKKIRQKLRSITPTQAALASLKDRTTNILDAQDNLFEHMQELKNEARDRIAYAKRFQKNCLRT